jgi:hypothetical protein
VLNRVQELPSSDDVRAEGVGMDDLTMTRLCAEAVCRGREEVERYDPISNDSQAMWLVKKLGLTVGQTELRNDADWVVISRGGDTCADKDLNRAIVECVAKMQKAKGE